MVQTELIHVLNTELEAELPPLISNEGLVQNLSIFINHLIQTNFQKLVLILYKVDVSESTLKQFLTDSQEDAATIIAKLIVEREIEKINTKKFFNHKKDICDEEKW
jgi:hypothetical protein